jgi:hypothetical protein
MTTIDILRRVRRLETALTARIERAAAHVRSEGPREPIEIAHAVVEEAARHVQPGGRGRYVFPYTRLKVSVVARDKDTRARLEAVLDGDPCLHDRIAERLNSVGCDVGDLDVKTVYLTEPGAGWSDDAFHVEGQRVSERARAVTAPEAPDATLKLTIEHGKAEQASYTFSALRVDLGRGAHVRDRRERLIRTNHVAFIDGGVDANASVSRQHAHIVYDAAAQQHRLCDDRSAHGTGILRSGRLIAVPGGARGLRLLSGDVIFLGEARLRVTLSSA